MTHTTGSAPDAPEGVDTEKPSAARMYDWYLGGDQNWAVDREFGRRVEAIFPLIKEVARQNRQFLGRVVRAALDAGFRQFLDIGSGVPTVGNVHEVVAENLPEGEEATVVYVDYEPVAAAHATLLLERHGATGWAAMVQEDLRNPENIFRDPTTRRLIDFRKPVCLLMVAVFQFVGDDDHPVDLVERYRRELAPGSWLALSHLACDEASPADQAAIREFVDAYVHTSNPAWLRDRSEVEPLFGDWPLIEPGLTHLPDWRPDRAPNPLEAKARPFWWCGVAEKPGR
ncbi:SAM-dependent methyltransferase [Amycolatopsis anabasis]|uniref:SAM-dependent methyltransferase n=1 Tax=Amycolatopsis anabasis TaxID=1840409 RepID=UPI00131AB0B4|nr:SAM-dependent methyltransferase [Amycolatopsis anabasis]